MLIFLAIGIIFLGIFLYFVPINLWITAVFSGVQVSIFELIFMRIRKTPPGLIIQSKIMLDKAGVKVSIVELETLHLASGDVKKVTNSLIKLKKKGKEIPWTQAMAIHLAGNDIEEYLWKMKLEKDDGIEELRNSLSETIMSRLDAGQVREVADLVRSMVQADQK
jgi:uncharacterized protein YqfA (UPF0365 family)